MTDEFAVSAKETEVLNKSHLVAELSSAAATMETFPVLLDEYVAHFHSIDGGYHRSEGYHVVNFIHEVQGYGSPDRHKPTDVIEAHLDDTYFYLEIEDVWRFGDYPDEAYTLAAMVTGYESGPYSFSEALTDSIDKRETEYEYE